MTLVPAAIGAGRVVLVPIFPDTAQAILAGDLSLVRAGDGWPHEDTYDGLRMSLEGGHAPGWFVTLDGAVIGDCGIHGEPDRDGVVEIGFGLAAPYRGRGHGAEVVRALTRWLLAQSEVSCVIARVAPGNIASRRTLEGAGFIGRGERDALCVYVREAAPRE
ncbi:MAG TPA: GNAT family N-acetyltransferase [Solirubrobacteraceae bacterium]|nr:GNAT family N-acetyltransferase [Solirubrobacteraceae bacterium]